MSFMRGMVTRRGRLLGVHFKDAPSAPAAPDYTGAAQATAQGNLESARLNAKANRINQYTPYGSLIYSHTGSDPDAGWSQTVNLSPAQQQLLDAQNRTSLGLSGLMGQGLGYVRDALGHGITLADLPKSMVDAGQTGQDALMARFAPQIAQSRAALENQLANQGIMPGSEAYDNAMRTQQQSENDLRMQAALKGIDVGNQAQTQQLGLLQALRNDPINVLNAVRTGAQVTNPAFERVAQQGLTQGPDLLGATQAQGNYNQGLYNSQVAAYNANGGFLGPIGGAALNLGASALAGGWRPSDARLKRDIEPVGALPNGLSVYQYRYVWDEDDAPLQLGVMAQEALEVVPEAVAMHPAGFLMVDYGRLV